MYMKVIDVKGEIINLLLCAIYFWIYKKNIQKKYFKIEIEI
jgi:hypothetical protein